MIASSWRLGKMNIQGSGHFGPGFRKGGLGGSQNTSTPVALVCMF